jgi:thiol-disulfide isomerase/thioredoxin
MKKLLFVTAIAAGALAFAVNSSSGLNVGEMVTPFHPKHIAGPDKGTDTCPPCKYGARPAVQAWVHPSEKADVVAALAKTLSANVAEHKAADFKSFMIAESAKIDNIGIATLGVDDKALKAYKVNASADVKNTVIVYKDKKVAAKFVNLTDSKEDLAKLQAAIDGVTSK